MENSRFPFAARCSPLRHAFLAQLQAFYARPADAFPTFMSSRWAAGYLLGYERAVLGVVGAGPGQDAADDALDTAYAALFGDWEGSALLSWSLELEGEDEFDAGCSRGAHDLRALVHDGAVPQALCRFLLLAAGIRTMPALDYRFNEVLFALQQVLRRRQLVPQPTGDGEATAGADGLEDRLIPLAYGVEALRSPGLRSPGGVGALRSRVGRRWVSLRLELARRRPPAQAQPGQPIDADAIGEAVEHQLQAVDSSIAGPLATLADRAAARARLLHTCFPAEGADGSGPECGAVATALEPFIAEWLAAR